MSNHKRVFRILAFAALFVVRGLVVTETRAETFIIDQANAVGGVITSGGLTNGQSLGQTFIPSLTGIDFFDVHASSRGVSEVRLSLLAGPTITGMPIASSSPMIITNALLQTVEFRFASTISLIPGNPYTARLELISGDSYKVEFSVANPYVPGLALDSNGQPNFFVDWVFAEGVIQAPEPSCTLLIFGGLLVIMRVRRKACFK
jgi:hypothetical protein